MKRKSLKILCGCLAALCVVGATSTVVGALSDGFKNWDTSTWFDKTQTEPIPNEDIITTPDETQPVKMSIRYLGDESRIKKVATDPDTSGTYDIKPMTGLVITASLDSQYGECNNFTFSFSHPSEEFYSYEVTENTCTITFLKKGSHKFFIYATSNTLPIKYRGKVGVDFLSSVSSSISALPVIGNGFYQCSNPRISFDFSKEYSPSAGVLLEYQLGGSIYHNIKDFEFTILNNNLSVDFATLFFLEDFTCPKLKMNYDDDLINQIVNDDFLKDKDVLTHVADLKIDIVTNYERSVSGTFNLYMRGFSIMDGGVDMGGDIVVG